jgi:phage FluMu gp28-like protein
MIPTQKGKSMLAAGAAMLGALTAQAGTPMPLPAPLAPVMSRNPAQLPPELPRGFELPEDHDPLAAGILMDHQKEWLEDQSSLKLCEKGRRTGITYAEALDDTIIAASARSQGGDNVFYIGDTKDKGREFIGYVAHFAKIVAKELVDVEEFLFEDQLEDGTSKFISAYRVRFASGFRVEALSSRPENIRGLQGIVVIDEAAFHKDVRQVLDAVNALLIWEGKIRIISTHNGVLNPFNELIQEAKAGKVSYTLHFIPFQKAVDNGLFKRVCLTKGKPWSQEDQDAWEAKIRGAYGVRTAQMRQELDAIPSDAAGSALSRVMIESNSDRSIPVIRWALQDAFKSAPAEERKRIMETWLREKLRPVLDKLDPDRRHDFGQDFARSGDGSVIIVNELGRDLVRRGKLVIELRNVPYETQRDVVFFLGDALPRFGHAAFDATGNGAYLAEVAQQRWGERVSEVKLNAGWYGANSPAYVEAFADGTIVVAGDDDIIRDHQALQYVDGIIRVPENFRYKGGDGFDRHGDAGIAGILAWYASRQGATEYGYTPVPIARANPYAAASDDGWDGDDEEVRSWWKPPLGTGLRRSIWAGALKGVRSAVIGAATRWSDLGPKNALSGLLTPLKLISVRQEQWA